MKRINALTVGMLAICACSDPTGLASFHSSGQHPENWVGHYASSAESVIMDGTPTTVQARLDLYQSPACHLYVEFSTAELDDWAVTHSDSCLYYVESGAVTLQLTMRVHYPGGTDLTDVFATFEPVDEYWTALIWRNLGIRLERAVQSTN